MDLITYLKQFSKMALRLIAESFGIKNSWNYKKNQLILEIIYILCGAKLPGEPPRHNRFLFGEKQLSHKEAMSKLKDFVKDENFLYMRKENNLDVCIALTKRAAGTNSNKDLLLILIEKLF